MTGKCIGVEDEKFICNQQCPGVGGTFVEGTGLCQCETITDVDEICNSACVAKMPKSKLGPDGKMTITDPTTNKTSTVDPSTLPGYYGNFKCETTNTATTDCKVLQMGMTEDGSFSYEFEPNADILNATNIPNNTEFKTSTIRRQQVLRKA